MKRLKRILAMLLVCCMVGSFMPMTAEATIINNGPSEIQFANFFSAAATGGVSTNDHYTIMGIGVDENGQAYAIMGSDKGSKWIKDLDWFTLNPTAPKLDDVPEEKRVYLEGENDEVFYDGEQLGIQLSDGSKVVLNGEGASHPVVGYFVIPLGDFDALMAEDPTFNVAIDCSESGWDIECPGIEVTVNLNYDIKKEVDKAVAESGETLTYTVTINNTGDYFIPNVDVYDILPSNLDETTVSVTVEGQVHDWSWGTDPEGKRAMVLDSGITLAVGGTKTYKISANVKSDYKGGTLTNTAIIGSSSLAEKEAIAETEVIAYFYIHHIYNDGTVENQNGVEQRIDKVAFNEALKNGAKFDINDKDGGGVKAESLIQDVENNNIGSNEFIEGKYEGLLPKTLYGGTFNETVADEQTTYTVPYKFDEGENGIGFTPKVNEHYYVWEPTNKYLRPINLAVWHTHGTWKPEPTKDTQYHTVAGYPVTAVDRVNYQEFGFIENDVITSEEIYETVNAQQNFDYSNVSELKAEYLGLTGYLGCYKFPEKIFNEDLDKGETFLPYWITHDGVKVTGIYQRNAIYNGLGKESDNPNKLYYKTFTVSDDGNTYSVETYEAPSNNSLMAKAMFYDNNLTHPLIPEIVGVNFEGITAGNSGNIKSVKLNLDLSEFKYDRAWFDVNGEMVEAQERDGMLSATISHKKDTELTVVPHWSYGDKEFTGAAKLLSVTKKNVEDITPVASVTAKRMQSASFKSSMSLNEDNNGVILQ